MERRLLFVKVVKGGESEMGLLGCRQNPRPIQVATVAGVTKETFVDEESGL